MKIRVALLFLFLFILTGMAAFAQDATPKADARQATERARIRQGRKSGELTNKEAAGLNSQQRRIRRTERRAKSDGDCNKRGEAENKQKAESCEQKHSQTEK